MLQEEKTFLLHSVADDALFMTRKFCEDTECDNFAEGECRCHECAVHEFEEFCKSWMFSDTVSITELGDEDTFDSEDRRYPSEYFLACLSDIKAEPVETFVNADLFWKWLYCVERVWNWSDEAWILDEKEMTLTLHTYGWSGNESIINALHHTMFWALCFQKSERGGHYVFDLSNLAFVKKQEEE